MDFLLSTIIEALGLLARLDAEVWEIIARSILFALSSTLLSSLPALPLGVSLALSRSRSRPLFAGILRGLYAVPTVGIGIFLFILLSRSGPLGSLGILYSGAAVVAGQAILILPIMTGLSFEATVSLGITHRETLETLGAGRLSGVIATLKGARRNFAGVLAFGFGRALSEVGISVIVGGNIRHATRTITSTMALEISRGEASRSLALGMALVGLAVLLNLAAGPARGGES